MFLVLVRYAYGVLDFLFTYESALTMPLRSARLIIANIITTTGCCPVDLQDISFLLGRGGTPLTLALAGVPSTVPLFPML